MYRLNLLVITLFAACVLITSTAVRYEYDDYDSNEDGGGDNVLEPCDSSRCVKPKCSCFTTSTPDGLNATEIPQFVILTFDDAINVVNAKTYRRILGKRKNKANGCPIAMTFFVCHEYNDYQITNELYKRGNEIGVHSITHESDTEMWKFSNIDRWTNEMVGMRKILEHFGQIPASAVRGHRAPFLQTAGNNTFGMLAQNDFLYDASMPTLTYMKPPIWPYTLDHGYSQDCQIRPCPKGSFPGLWVVPMVQYQRVVTNEKGQTSTFHCSMADACTPYPLTADETKRYLMDNFDRHYGTNRAPFPVFLHEAWLKDEKRLEGYLAFIDDVLQREDVFLVTIQEVLEYMKKPVTLDEYKKRTSCFAKTRPSAGVCSEPRNCNFPKKNRHMKSCANCPRRYPWLGNPLGQKL